MDIDEIIQRVLDRTDVEFDVLLESADFTLSKEEETFAQSVRYEENPDYAIIGILQKRHPDFEFFLKEGRNRESILKMAGCDVDMPTPDEVQYNESIVEEHPLGEIVGSFECLVWLKQNGYHIGEITRKNDSDWFGGENESGLFGAI